MFVSRRDVLRAAVASALLIPSLAQPAVIAVASAAPTTQTYVGVPEPTDPVPSAIMPTLPTSADNNTHEWINTYDPRTEPAPSHATIAPNWPSAEQANVYYIDAFHGSATDTNNTYGYPDQPRATIPAGAYGSSAIYVEIHGNNNAWPGIGGSPDYDLNSIVSTGMTGTSSQPLFWKGVDSPWLGWEIELNAATHVIFDDIHLMGSPGNQPQGRLRIFPGCSYVTFRNGTVRGDGVGASSGIRTQVVDISGTSTDINQFILVYNNLIGYGGDYTQEFNRDVHGVRPLYYNRHVWILDNEIRNLQGDCIQIGNSANTDPNEAQRTHYCYFAGNTCHKTWENIIDCKTSYHFIASENEMYDCPDAVLCILTNNDEGALTGYHWLINNVMRDAPFGCVRMSGDQAGQMTYVIGNLMRDSAYGIRFADHSGTDDNDEWALHNTIVNCATPMNIGSSGSSGGDNLVISGNITYDDTGTHMTDGGNNGAQGYTGTTALNYHVSYNTDLSATNLPTTEFDSTTGLQEDQDPLFTNVATDDYTLQAGSPAIDLVATLDPAFDAFFDLYGISIKKDIAGNTIPDTNADAGAYQRAA